MFQLFIILFIILMLLSFLFPGSYFYQKYLRIKYAFYLWFSKISHADLFFKDKVDKE